MEELKSELLKLTGADQISTMESVQSLWSGYGEILRFHLSGGNCSSVIVKHIRWPDVQKHPRGWNTSLSHERKLRSYQVEQCWYESYAARTTPGCRVPQLYTSLAGEQEVYLLLEDLNASGYSGRLEPETVSMEAIKSGLRWLAHFHAAFLGKETPGLWPVGTYWHLDTRPGEWAKMRHQSLKKAARQIDERLTAAKFLTLVHGDAKLANFCFRESAEVAAVDFQYVGQGCGMKDVAYFISSCLEEEDCEKYEAELLSFYFGQLEAALDQDVDFDALQEEWQRLYHYAWADFYRFLDGWSPGHWKMHRYSGRLASEVIADLNNSR